VFVFAPRLSALVTEKRQLTRQNHRGGVSSASPSPHRGIDSLRPRATPTRAAGDRYLCCFIRQPPADHGERRIHALPPKIQQPSNNNAIVHAPREKAVASLPDVGRAAERACTPLPLRLRHSLSQQLAMRPRRSTCLLRVGYAQVSQAVSGVTEALDGDGQSLP